MRSIAVSERTAAGLTGNLGAIEKPEAQAEQEWELQPPIVADSVPRWIRRLVKVMDVATWVGIAAGIALLAVHLWIRFW